MAGVDGYLFSAINLRKTVKVNTRSTIVASWEDVNFVVTLESINPPDAVIGSLNELERLASGEMGDGEREVASWEWLKKAPTVRTAGKPKLFEVSYEWWGTDRWSRVLYGGSWDPMPDW